MVNNHAPPDHAKSANNQSDHAMAAGDLDQYGSDELVFVSAPQITKDWQVEISVLDLRISPTLSAETIDSISQTIPLILASEPSTVWDVNVATGDLDECRISMHATNLQSWQVSSHGINLPGFS